MWQQQGKNFSVFLTGIKNKLTTIRQPKLIRSLMLTIGTLGILIIIILPLSYKPDTSAPFPFIAPPPNGYHIETSPNEIQTAFFSNYVDPKTAEMLIGESLIFKNVSFTESLVSMKTETSITMGFVQFVAQNPSDLRKLKAGDKVDIIGICTGRSEELSLMVVIEECQFLPKGLAPLPLPGGPAVIIGY